MELVQGVAVRMATYGHLTLEEWEALEGRRTFEQAGRWYRITDYHAIPALSRVNYQAEEMTDHEVQIMLSGEQWKVVFPDPGIELPEVEVSEFGLRVKAPEDPDDFEWPATGLKPSNPAYQMEGVPALSVWAKTHGWSGRGRISNEVRYAYHREFRLPYGGKTPS